MKYRALIKKYKSGICCERTSHGLVYISNLFPLHEKGMASIGLSKSMANDLCEFIEKTRAKAGDS